MAIKHGVHDTDTHFIIDPITRAAKNDGLKKVSIVRDDHNSEVCTFELPRYVEGHDMSLCNKVEVHYLNTHGTTKAKSTGVYEIADFRLDEDDPDKVIGSWLIDCLATKYPGSLAFSIHFACVDDTGTVAYWWSSATNTSISVLDSINLTESGGGGGGSVEESDLQEKTAAPAAVPQVIRPDNGFYGLSKVTVEAIPEDYIVPSGSLFIASNGEHQVKQFDTVRVNVPPTLQDKTITSNGTYTPDYGYDGLGSVSVDIKDAPAVLQEKTVYPSSFAQSVTPDEGFDGLSKVTMEAMRLQSVIIDTNGEVLPDRGYDGFSSVTVNVKTQDKLQSKSLTFTENGDTEVIADSGYGGLSAVKIKVDVKGAGKLQTKVAKENGEYEPDKEFDALDLVKVEVPQTVYTGVAYTEGGYPVYGGVDDIVVISGNPVERDDGDGTKGEGRTSYTFKEMTTSGDLSTWESNAGVKVELAETQTLNGRTQYTFKFYMNNRSISTRKTYVLGDYGFRVKWNALYAPTPEHPNGYARVTFYEYYTNDDNELTVVSNLNYQRYVAFNSLAEYNAAVKLVEKPAGLIKINEETFFAGNAKEA